MIAIAFARQIIGENRRRICHDSGRSVLSVLGEVLDPKPKETNAVCLYVEYHRTNLAATKYKINS